MYEILSAILFVIVIILFLQILKLKKKASYGEKFMIVEKEASQIKGLYENLKNGYKNLEEQNNLLKEKIKTLEQKIAILQKANIELLEKKEQLQESKEKLELLHKKKNELFAIALHDIKNPISAIRSYLDLLESYDLTAQEQQEIMEGLIQSSEKVVKLAQEITEVIVSDDVSDNLKFEELQLGDIIHSVYIQNLAYAESKKIKLINKSSNQLPMVKADPDKIEEAIDNYVNNAIKYSPPDTEVLIKSYFNPDYVTIEVIDNGPGIDPEFVHKVFDKGVILDNEPTGDETRNGIGLWIVKHIVEKHGGKVWVKSKPGLGSTFGMDLPRVKEEINNG